MLQHQSQILQEGGRYGVPQDIHGLASESVVLKCYEDGALTQDFNNKVSGCHNYHSASTNTNWRIRFAHGGTDRVFKVIKRKEGNKWVSVPIFWMRFDTQDVHRVLEASPEAQKIADANGSGVPATSPSDEQVAQKESSQSTDCNKLSGLKKVECFAKGGGLPAGIGSALGK